MNVQALRAETIASFEADKAESAALLQAITSREVTDAYIVRQSRGMICLSYERVEGGVQPHIASPKNAQRFQSSALAHQYAQATQNGFGETASVVKLSQALADDIEKLQGLLDTLREIQASEG